MEKRQDLISRQAAIDEWKKDFKGYVNALNIPRDDYNGIMEYIDELPPAQPKRHRGKWIDCNWSARCSECDYSMPWAVRNFCPNCGSDMRGEQDG